MSQLGFSAQELESDTTGGKLFITGIAAFLTDLGLIELTGDELSCKVTQVFDGVVVEVSCEEEKTEEHTEALFVFDTVKRLTAFCCKLSGKSLEMLRSCELYKLSGLYCLIAVTDCSKAELHSCKQLRNADFDEVRIQKAREYGELLSRTPIKTIRSLNDP